MTQTGIFVLIKNLENERQEKTAVKQYTCHIKMIDRTETKKPRDTNYDKSVVLMNCAKRRSVLKLSEDARKLVHSLIVTIIIPFIRRP